jgi:hypothetical protein
MHRDMEQTCPSSNNWVKFEDSDQVTHPAVSSNIKKPLNPGPAGVVLTPQLLHKSQLSEDGKHFQKKNINTSHHSRYSAFDQLRLGVMASTELGWSSYLLDKQGKEDARSRKHRG